MNSSNKKIELRFEANSYPLETGLRLIEASAGTGKTFALAHLVLRLVTEGKYKLKDLLVITFTEAAASELGARICNRLEAALKGIEALEKKSNYESPDIILKEWLELQATNKSQLHKWKYSLLEALEDLDRADITTIHGFCRRTLRREALANGSPIEPRLEEKGEELINQIAHKYWEQQVLELDAQDVKGLLSAGLSSDQLAASLQKTDNDPSLSLKIEEKSFDSFQPLKEQFKNRQLQLWNIFVENWILEGRELELQLREKAKEWRTLGLEKTTPYSPKPTKNRFDIVNQWINNLLLLQERSKERPSYGEIRNQIILGNYFHPAIFEKVSKLSGLEHSPLLKPGLQKAIADIWDSPAEQVLSHGLRWGIKEIEARRLKSGEMSYGGLITAMDPASNLKNNHDSLEAESHLLAGLRQRYKAVLIDEFQDTDPIQWRILDHAFGKSKGHLLLVVGDPKQAIYKFRGGDLNTYLKVRDQVNRTDVLLDNFRTTARLMEGLNQLMSPGLRRSELEVRCLISHKQEIELAFPKGMHPLQLLELNPANDSSNECSNTLMTKSDLEKQIPSAVANAIVEALEVHKNKLQPSEICILVNRHDQAASIREGLALVGLSSRLVSQGDVLKSDSSQILQRFINCLANPGDSKSLRLLACSALLQWNAKQLAEAESNGEIDRLALRFQDWANRLSSVGLLGCLGELLEGRNLADLSERGRLLGDMQQCAQLVQEAIHQQGLDATNAARWLKRQRLQSDEFLVDNRQPHSDVEENAINVLTVHRSKGLEFKAVVCPYLWQSPPTPNGPLWRLSPEPFWQISLGNLWGEAKKLADQAEASTLQEAERLAYVALTRAKSLLMIVWARGVNQEGNPLTPLLFGPQAMQARMEELTPNRMNKWLKGNNVEISILKANHRKSLKRWKRPSPKGDLRLGPTPKHRLNTSWGRSSYSAWISASFINDENAPSDPSSLEEGREREQQNHLSWLSAKNETNQLPILETFWSKQNPLGQFPRGPTAGECLHRILERIDFSTQLTEVKSIAIIEQELRRAGLESNLLSSIQEGLTRVFNTPLRGPLGSLSLNQLTKVRRIHELSFDMPIAYRGKEIRAEDLVNIFKKDPQSRFAEDYAKQLMNLDFSSKGFFTGSIDLVFTDHKDPSKAQWWVADWKSNWIGKCDSNGKSIECGPFHYNIEAMEQQMILHHYPLQSHLYLLALHRFLQWRLKDYDPEKHLGGYVYVFLRGIPDLEEVKNQPKTNFIPGLIIDSAPIERIKSLDQLLQQGGQ